MVSHLIVYNNDAVISGNQAVYKEQLLNTLFIFVTSIRKYIHVNMNICRYLYCTIVCCITTLTFRIVNAKNEDVRSGSFKTKGSTIILQSENTTDVYSMSLISCADMCLSDPQCCVASYLKGTSTCRIDTSARCCVETKPLTGWRFIEKKSYRKYM